MSLKPGPAMPSVPAMKLGNDQSALPVPTHLRDSESSNSNKIDLLRSVFFITESNVETNFLGIIDISTATNLDAEALNL